MNTEILHRCLASVLRVADLIEGGDTTSAIETCHLIADDLEDLAGQLEEGGAAREAAPVCHPGRGTVAQGSGTS